MTQWTETANGYKIVHIVNHEHAKVICLVRRNTFRCPICNTTVAKEMRVDHLVTEHGWKQPVVAGPAATLPPQES